ncbi:hypothetical protein NIES2135_34350 [Leptolyngbya boryana NIES-2135]|jgi:hypothetical protein|uniref:Uncharacterized protein n=1 Tax=Leptolyngbya boryana NIES-2135 TaxID=1973484 RepID=A0A1Z4JIM6_LEPBY|nr:MULTISPECIES: hypothetical protein [Leptolyngbya]BAY56601.1 hypothetical protein NIES2135_34350 [Leptolyngbya boryana NIES-2135]MBD2369903.1 hypothetical protein [Leptolyngbya sp. FACHB-161]MBD2376152.1 hypothetical protein [Leptolyngbya sp. FACHB-238]MBD2400427.1 hypothetical protein [Leptolyngbya sp. FACHB-239]MBD2406969.1 hypothetical protein [Leptolyngbya sp. FACHB-402]
MRQDDIQEWLGENWLGIAIGGISTIVLATQIPSIQDTIQRNQSVAQANKARLEENQKLEAQKLTLQASEDIANERYDKGCEVIVTLQNQRIATTIQEGQPIVSGAYSHLYQNSNRPLNPLHFVGRDVTVCDLYGTTAVMQLDPSKKYAVAGAIAVTRDRTRMNKAQQRMKGLERPNFKTSNK